VSWFVCIFLSVVVVLLWVKCKCVVCGVDVVVCGLVG